MSFMSNAITAGMAVQSDTHWHDLEQAFIDESWTNSTQIAEGLLEQPTVGDTIDSTTGMPSSAWNDVEAWHTPALEPSGTQYYRTEDLAVKFIFRNIDKPNTNGIYYRWKGNYWLGFFEYGKTTYQSYAVAVRCDNMLKYIDPIDHKTYVWPCRIDNEATASKFKETDYLMTPNNNYIIYVQRNKYTERICRLNRRFLIGGGGENDNLRPFKIVGLQNSHQDSRFNTANILYLNLSLDELQDNDDLENGIAYNADVKDVPEELEVFVLEPRPSYLRQNIPIKFKVSLAIGREDFVLKLIDNAGLSFEEIDKVNHICQVTSNIIGTCRFRIAAYEPTGPGIIVAPETITIESKSMIG